MSADIRRCEWFRSAWLLDSSSDRLDCGRPAVAVAYSTPCSHPEGPNVWYLDVCEAHARQAATLGWEVTR